MSMIQFLTFLGLATGAVWAFTGVTGALLAVGLAVVGYVVGLIVEGRVDLRDLSPRE